MKPKHVAAITPIVQVAGNTRVCVCVCVCEYIAHQANEFSPHILCTYALRMTVTINAVSFPMQRSPIGFLITDAGCVPC